MNAQALKDLEGLVNYTLETEREDFLDCITNNPEHFPGLNDADLEKIGDDPDGEKLEALYEKAARCKQNDHVYACAVRLWYAFLKK